MVAPHTQTSVANDPSENGWRSGLGDRRPPFFLFGFSFTPRATLRRALR